MRFIIVLIAMSMVAWVAAAAGVAGVGHPAEGAHALNTGTHPKVKVAEAAGEAADDGATDAGAAATTADAGATTEEAAPSTGEAIVSVDPAGAAGTMGAPPLAPSGPRTPAEEKADSVLGCVLACTTVDCQNQCVYTGYNVPKTPPATTAPVVVPSGATPASATPTSTTTTTTAQGSGASSYKKMGQQQPWHVPSFVVAIAVAVAGTVFA